MPNMRPGLRVLLLLLLLQRLPPRGRGRWLRRPGLKGRRLLLLLVLLLLLQLRLGRGLLLLLLLTASMGFKW